MSFGDLISSGRGPGFIGMLLALLVLVGFGGLYLFVFEAEQQQGTSIEVVIGDQQQEIDDLKQLIKEQAFVLDTQPVIEEINSKVALTQAANKEAAARIDRLTQDIEPLRTAIQDTAAASKRYKEDYRNHVRAQAAGEQLDELVLKSGAVYKKVEIREVTPVGMQIRHEDGQKRVPFEELPDEWQDRFQFDAEQKEALLAQEDANRLQHDQAVLDATTVAPVEIDERAVRRAAVEQKAKLRQAINDLEIRIAQARTEYGKLQADAAKADAQMADNKRRGGSSMNKSSGIRKQMQTKMSEISSMMRELATLKASR